MPDLPKDPIPAALAHLRAVVADTTGHIAMPSVRLRLTDATDRLTEAMEKNEKEGVL